MPSLGVRSPWYNSFAFFTNQKFLELISYLLKLVKLETYVLTKYPAKCFQKKNFIENYDPIVKRT